MASIYEIAKKAKEVGKGEGDDSVYSVAARAGKSPERSEEGGDQYGYSFGNEFLKSATAGYLGDEGFEPKSTGEKVAGIVGGLTGFILPAVALGPVGKLGASALGLGLAEKAGLGATVANMFARGATEGAIYEGAGKQEEGESRLESAARGAAEWGTLGALGGAAEYVGKKAGKAGMDFIGSLSDVSPGTIDKVMEAARKHQMTPEEIQEIIQGGTFGPGVQDTADKVAQRLRPLSFELGAEGPAGPSAAARKAEFFANRDRPPVPDPGARVARNLAEFIKRGQPVPTPGTKASATKSALEDFEPNRGPMVEAPAGPPTGVSPSMVAGITHPRDIEGIRPAPLDPQFPFPEYSRPGFEARGSGFEPDVPTGFPEKYEKKTPQERLRTITPEQLQEEEIFGAPRHPGRQQRTLIAGDFLTPESELTPKGAKYSGLFKFFGPSSVESKIRAIGTPIPAPTDPIMDKLPPAVAHFIRDEVHGPVAAASDSFAAGNDYFRAIDDGLQSGARGHRIEMSPMESPEAAREVENGRLAMGKAAEILTALDPVNPALDLSAKTGIPGRDSETVLMELAANARKPIKQVSVLPWEGRPYPPATTEMGEEIMSPEVLSRALQASDLTPEQFSNNPKLMQPNGVPTPLGKQLIRSIDPEWDIPYTEKVLDVAPLPRRASKSRKGKYYEPFDINSVAGRVGLASVRSGGTGSVPLPRGTMEGFLPSTLEYHIKKGWARKVPGGYQFTREGAIVASRPGGFVHAIDLAKNRRVEEVLLESGERVFEGGRMGKSFEGMTTEQAARAELDYQTAKDLIIEVRKAALEFKGC